VQKSKEPEAEVKWNCWFNKKLGCHRETARCCVALLTIILLLLNELNNDVTLKSGLRVI